MRFKASGPQIPDELIDLRLQGRLVFFCGAGVSVDSGMPGFLSLTAKVCADVHVSPNSEIGLLTAAAFEANDPSLTKPLDQIFGLLRREYGNDKIERLVCKHLQLRPDSPFDHHATIMNLSSDVDDNSLVVTTNFEELFERAKPKS